MMKTLLLLRLRRQNHQHHSQDRCRKLWITLLITVLITGCNKDAAHQLLSKESITKELQERAARNKTPIIIDKISDPQEMTLHGEKCLTVVAYIVNWPPVYFVTKAKNATTDLSGGNIIKDVDEKGFDAVAASLPTSDSEGNVTYTLEKTVYVSADPHDAKVLEQLDDSDRARMVGAGVARAIFEGSKVTFKSAEDFEGVDQVRFDSHTWYVEHSVMEQAIVN